MSTTRLCDEAGCDRPHRSNGLCQMHHGRLMRLGTTVTDREHALIADVLEWVMDGEPLTTPAERARHELLAA